mmetsp:Transcript_13517/g.9741  ORF Transcript_13517/g.9741 Transcript_13517/m.9741 type:complete len:96 (+) Transcript_13517:184-471(+)
MREIDTEIKEMAKKMYPKITQELHYSYMLQNDKFYISPDFVRFSIGELEGYRKFSRIVCEDMKGFVFDCEKHEFEQIEGPKLNYLKWKQLLLNKE